MDKAPESDVHGNRVALLMTIIWVFTVISTILAMCRIFTRLTLVNSAGKDDIAIFLSVVNRILPSNYV